MLLNWFSLFFLQLSLLGYRDAEVAFLEVSDSETPYTGYRNKPNNSVRKTLCLLIHAPHLHSLELWCLIHGPRIVSWDVVEPVRLIQTERQNYINTTKSNEFKWIFVFWYCRHLFYALMNDRIDSKNYQSK